MGKNIIHVESTYVEKIFAGNGSKFGSDGKVCLTEREHDENHFLLETDTLNIIKNNFINKPVINHYPFPAIISSNKENLSVKMTFCGLDLRTYRVQKRKTNREYIFNGHRFLFEPINEEYLIDTIDCIVNNLKNLFIVHHNIHERNFCINSKGQLHLIDFETATRKPDDYKKRKPERAAYCLERIEKYKEEFKQLIYKFIT